MSSQGVPGGGRHNYMSATVNKSKEKQWFGFSACCIACLYFISPSLYTNTCNFLRVRAVWEYFLFPIGASDRIWKAAVAWVFHGSNREYGVIVCSVVQPAGHHTGPEWVYVCMAGGWYFFWNFNFSFILYFALIFVYIFSCL